LAVSDIVADYPPNIDKIASVLPVKGRDSIVYTYGDTIYFPKGEELPPDLIAHEEVHMGQQASMGKDEWWDRYLKDVEFRLSQEVEAYRVQWQYAMDNYNRSHRRQLLDYICDALSSAMYGKIVSKKEAKGLITGD
jgi:hypothetical protein